MSKIFVTVLFLLVSLTSLSQVTIVELNGNVNTINSEFNFTQEHALPPEHEIPLISKLNNNISDESQCES